MVRRVIVGLLIGTVGWAAVAAAASQTGLLPETFVQGGKRSLRPVQAFADGEQGFLSTSGKPPTRSPDESFRRIGAQPPRNHPTALALSADERTLYVTLPGNEAEPRDLVAVIDTASRRVRTFLRVGLSPICAALHPAGRYLVVCNQFSNYLSVIDTATQEVVNEILVGFYVQQVVFNAAGTRAYLSNRALDAVEVLEIKDLRGDGNRLRAVIPVGYNPRDMALSADEQTLYVANLTDLDVSIVDLRRQQEVGRIDLNAPPRGLARAGHWLFVATMGVGSDGFDDVQNEIAVIDTRRNELVARFTSLPNPPLPVISRFIPGGEQGAAHNGDPTLSGPFANLVPLVDGALPQHMVVRGDRLFVVMSASDQLEVYTIDTQTRNPKESLRPAGVVYTNATQTFAPTVFPLSIADRIDPAVNRPHHVPKGLSDRGDPVYGDENPAFFMGRLPEQVAVTRDGRLAYVANRLGEAVSVLRVAPGQPLAVEALIDLRVPGTPHFPATLAELGEDFYTSSRIAVDRDIACLSCHDQAHRDGKRWAVPATPSNATRLTLSNRNLRETEPFFWSGVSSTLEFFRGTLRAFNPDNRFGGVRLDASGNGKPEFAVFFRTAGGRKVADANRDAMFIFERTGIGFEATARALAAFLNIEPRLLPNPFLQPDGELAPAVPLIGHPGRVGNAVRGAELFDGKAKCAQCHKGALYGNNKVLTPYFDRDGDGKPDPRDLDGDGILDVVIPNIFPKGLASAYPDPLTPVEAPDPHTPNDEPLAQPEEATGQFYHSVRKEQDFFNDIDTDPRIFASNSYPESPDTHPHSPVTGEPLFNGDTILPVSAAEFQRLLAQGKRLRPVNVTKGGDSRDFNVRSLRGVWDAPPYFHDGRARTLREVITLNVHDAHGVTSGLTPQEIDDLAAFLQSIE
ncbi:MAG: hypothetical protein KatS3mg131_1838 [Candidatus Tectimicrobiota bacterium]|nr:MAG: hypothetical protein KatS3mg131_1838 [Candidatus Tectomicrobia bacterium]